MFNLIKGRFPVPWGVRSAKKWLFHTPSACGGVVDSILFQQFRRTACAENQTGWGLGLFLAKSIVEAHQGTLEVESAEGKGTSFIIRLPKSF